MTVPSAWSLSLLLGMTSIQAWAVKDGLVAAWHFDEGSGPTASDAAGGHDGILVDFDAAGVPWVAGPDGKGTALSFDGKAHVRVPHAPSLGEDLAGGFTLMARFRPAIRLSATGAGRCLLSKGGSFHLLQGIGHGGMNFLVGTRRGHHGVGIGRSLRAGTWYHLAAVHDGTTARIHLDGLLKGSVPLPSPMVTDEADLLIGTSFRGDPDQLLLWNRPLGFEEIRLAMKGDLDVEVEAPPIRGDAVIRILADGTIMLQDREVDAEELVDRLRQASRADPDLRIGFRAERDTSARDVLSLMELMRALDISYISMGLDKRDPR